MDQHDIHFLIAHPENLDEDSLQFLKGLVVRYPYFQTAWVLYLKNLFILGKPEFKDELRKGALFVADLSVLFYYIEGERFLIKKHVAEARTVTDGTADRTLDLIDRFLSELPEKETPSKPIPEVPVPMEMPADYTSVLLSEISEDEKGTSLLHGHELIDQFIEKSEAGMTEPGMAVTERAEAESEVEETESASVGATEAEAATDANGVGATEAEVVTDANGAGATEAEAATDANGAGATEAEAVTDANGADATEAEAATDANGADATEAEAVTEVISEQEGQTGHHEELPDKNQEERSNQKESALPLESDSDTPENSDSDTFENSDSDTPLGTDSDTPQNTEEETEENYFTETLAKIYVRQQRYEKALEIIKKLNLKYPKKNAYFADQIRFLEKLIINAKSK